MVSHVESKRRRFTEGEEEEEREGWNGIPDTALVCVLAYIDDPRDRSAISLVCKRWHLMDGWTRKSVTMALCYAAEPSRLTSRFRALEAIKLKGKPRASMYKLIPSDWGGYAEPWVREMAAHCPCLKSIHLRRMILTDQDIFTLARTLGPKLHSLKLDKCSGFSTYGLEVIARACRSLRVLFLDECIITDHSGKWLHELALHNSSLEVLNFHATFLQEYDIADLETLVVNCKGLTSLKVNEVELARFRGVLSRARALEELGGVIVESITEEDTQRAGPIVLPRTLTSLVGLCSFGESDNTVISTVLPLAASLKKLDLQCAFLTIQGHCQLLRHCHNLEILEVLNAVGDEGLEAVGSHCPKLRRLRVERGADRDFQQGFVTQKGLTALAHGCPDLEYIAVYTSDIDNAALLAMGRGWPRMRDFRLVLLDEENAFKQDGPLDIGVEALMRGCPGLTRFALYLKRGLLTDGGMESIGRYGSNLRWALLGLLGESDNGLSLFAEGCSKLERLEMRDCVFSEAGIAAAVTKLKSLKYLWVQGYAATAYGHDLLLMRRRFWNIELIPEHTVTGDLEEVPGAAEDGCDANKKQPVQFVAYYSLTGTRKDHPDTVICLS